jgi:hypothetical protein
MIAGLALLAGLAGECRAAAAPAVTILGAITENLRTPAKIALDSAGRIHVADTQNRGVSTFDRYGSFQGRITVPGVVRGVACTADDRIIVSHGSTVTLYDRAGTVLGSLSGFAFQLPTGITTDADGRIYVVDSKANRVAVFSAAGQFSTAFGVAGSRPGQFNFPTAIAYEKISRQLAVADTLNNRVLFFATDGTYKRAVGTPTLLSGPLCFAYPQGIAFDYSAGVRMYVTDTYQSSVQVIELGQVATFLAYIGSYGTAEGQLMRPTDAAFDPLHRRLLVADGSGVIAIYGIDGGTSPVDPARPAFFLNPVPAMVATPALSIDGNVAPGAAVTVTVGSGQPLPAAVNGSRWNAVLTLSPGENIITVTGTGPGDWAETVALAVTWQSSPTVIYGDPAGGSGTGSSGSGSAGHGTAGTSGSKSWSYPTGIDCRHGRSGNVLCR